MSLSAKKWILILAIILHDMIFSYIDPNSSNLKGNMLIWLSENNGFKVCSDLGPQRTVQKIPYLFFNLEECFCFSENYAPAKIMWKYYGARQINHRFLKEITNLKNILLLVGWIKNISNVTVFTNAMFTRWWRSV